MPKVTKFFDDDGKEVSAAQATWAQELEWDAQGNLISSTRYDAAPAPEPKSGARLTGRPPRE
jgi:YD repeat-containing protein